MIQRRKIKVGHVGLDVLPTVNIAIPDQILNRVIYNQNIQGRKMLEFCSDFGLNVLRNYNNEIAVDGTFEVKYFTKNKYSVHFLDLSSWI